MTKTILAGVICLCLTAFISAQDASNVSRSQFVDDWKSLPQQLFDGSSLYFDNFNGDNTGTGLTARGYVVLNQDGGGTTDPFFQGNPTVLTAYEGPTNGYVASNYQGANGLLIDHWLISPPINVTAGDTLSFWHRAPDNNPFDDSIFVRYSTTAGITPAAFDVTWGRYLVSESGWARWTGTFNHTGTIRFAIQYYHTNGGPSGSYSNFLGIDLLEVISSTAATTARVQVIHNSADVLADSVDVYINGSLAINNFTFRTATPFLDLPAGVTLNIGVAPKTSASVNDTLKNFPVVLTAGEKYVVIANGVLNPALYSANPDGRNTAFTLLIKTMAREVGVGSAVDFFVLHGSTDAPTVDVKAREAGNVTLVNDAAYTDITSYISVPSANYTLDLYLADGTTLVASFIAPLAGLGGGAASVFASGFLNPAVNQNGEAFGIFAALANGTVVQFSPGVVPVELSSFTANTEGNSVSLKWTTATEVNNRGFEVQRKSEGNYMTIAFIEGKGTTSEIQNYTFRDSELASGNYTYRLKQIDFDGTFEYSSEIEIDLNVPVEFSLEQNFPNPFNPSTKISFNLAVESDVSMKVFNVLGQEVAVLLNTRLNAGGQDLQFNAENLNSGVYYYRIEASGIDGTKFTQTKKMLMVK